jgi:mRNA-degrading endonuclease RelE of RelBE toxin-antitoxin system
MYSIELTEKSEKFLKKIEKTDAEIILKKIHSLKENPFPHLKKLKGERFWRLRTLKYRAIIDIIISGRRIIVLKIGRRKNVYN